eukprot:8871475-Alexandrium_andersonii.AAC.1
MLWGMMWALQDEERVGAYELGASSDLIGHAAVGLWDSASLGSPFACLQSVFCALRARVNCGLSSMPESSGQLWMHLACACARQWTCR